jgi:hypothetical protein
MFSCRGAEALGDRCSGSRPFFLSATFTAIFSLLIIRVIRRIIRV